MSDKARRGSIAGGVVLTLIGVLLLAGCGGSGDQPTETAPRLTKTQLVKQLSDICQEHTDRQVVEIERFDKKHGIPYGPKHEDATNVDLERELTVVILPIVHDTIHDVRQLRPPSSQEATFDKFIASLEHGVKASEADPSWVATGTTEPFSEARALSWKLGTALCGQA